MVTARYSFLLKLGNLTQCKYFHSNLGVCADLQIYMFICLYNTAGDRMHNIPVKTMGLGPGSRLLLGKLYVGTTGVFRKMRLTCQPECKFSHICRNLSHDRHFN